MSMSKIRLLFFILVFVITAAGLLIFRNFEAPVNPEIQRISDFKVVEISGNGKIYQSKRPIRGDNVTSLDALDIKRMIFEEEIYLKSDRHTAFQFYCSGTSFSVLPGSSLYFHPKTRELYVYSGELYWQKMVKKKALDISLREPQNKMKLSDSGRIKIDDTGTWVWNFKGNLQVTFGGESFGIPAQKMFQALVTRRPRPPEVVDLLAAPQNPDPLDRRIDLVAPADSVVRFNWSVVPGVPVYIFRLYSSRLKENVLSEKHLSTNRVNVDLLLFEEREFFWEVFPLDTSNQREGVPSRLGYIKLQGSLLAKKNIQEPPSLDIKSIQVTGNMVLIEGTAERNSQLYINDQQVNVDTEGGFIFTLTFKTMGPKRIFFRLQSPLGLETTTERFVTIHTE